MERESRLSRTEKYTAAKDTMEKENCVYILKCKDGSLYTGWTNNLSSRVEAHNQGLGAKYTRGRGPVELVYAEYFEDKPTALRREAAIKKLTKTQKNRLIIAGRNEL